MSQTLALFHDAYRELNSKRMFWITLIISAVVVLAFFAIGVTFDGYLSIFGMRLSLPLPMSKIELYKLAFTALGINLWLTMVGTILAVISTAGIFPDLITGGSIDLYLSKPISRLRLFLTKYVTGLMFVAFQVLAFSAGSFLVIGVRGGLWEPRIFLAVPLVVCFFSYLFCISVLIGLLTRSTIAAVLLTLLFWLLVGGLDRADVILLLGKIHGEQQVLDYEPLIKQQRGAYNSFQERISATQPTTRESQELDDRKQNLQKSIDDQERAKSTARTVTTAHRVIYEIKRLLPKTRETNELLDRYLLTPEELSDYDSRRKPGGTMRKSMRPPQRSSAGAAGWTDPDTVREAQAEMRARPISWVVGTSLAFEALIVAWAAWIFCRRDY